MNRWLHTTRFTRGKLPHWEVSNGRYYLDAGAGECRLRDHRAAKIVSDELESLADWRMQVSATGGNAIIYWKGYWKKRFSIGTNPTKTRSPEGNG